MSGDVSDSARNYVRENREPLITVLHRGDDEFARACASALLDAAGEPPEINELAEEREWLESDEAR